MSGGSPKASQPLTRQLLPKVLKPLSSPAVTLALGTLLLLMVWFLDKHTPAEVRLTVLYLAPIGFMAWFGGPAMGYLFALLSGAATFHANQIMFQYDNPHFHYWNGAISLSTFLVVAAFSHEVARLRRLKKLEGAAKDAAEEAARFRSYVVSLVNHEFANALTLLMGALATLRVTEPAPISEKRRRAYKAINKVITGLRGATMNFLNLDRLQSGNFQPDMRRTSVRPLVESVLMGFESLASSLKLKIKVEFPPEDVSVCSDPDALRLVLNNLVHNAIKYAIPGGRISIKAEPGKESVEISVQDTGIGITPQDQERIFAGFYRSRQAKQTAPHGFGVGLKVSHDLLQAQGCELRLESRLGQGSRFYFRLPLWRERAGITE